MAKLSDLYRQKLNAQAAYARHIRDAAKCRGVVNATKSEIASLERQRALVAQLAEGAPRLVRLGCRLVHRSPVFGAPPLTQRLHDDGATRVVGHLG